MSLDGGRLQAHQTRMKNFRRRKDGKIKGSNVKRISENQRIEFDKIDAVELEKIKNKIRRDAKRKNLLHLILFFISIGIAVFILSLFAGYYE